jgi:hypothetical protein
MCATWVADRPRPVSRVWTYSKVCRRAIDVVAELAGNDPVERHHEYVVAVYGQTLRLKDTLDAAHEAERLSAARPRHATGCVGVRVDEGWHLRAAHVLVPRRFRHDESLSRPGCGRDRPELRSAYGSRLTPQ